MIRAVAVTKKTPKLPCFASEKITAAAHCQPNEARDNHLIGKVGPNDPHDYRKWHATVQEHCLNIWRYADGAHERNCNVKYAFAK